MNNKQGLILFPVVILCLLIIAGILVKEFITNTIPRLKEAPQNAMGELSRVLSAQSESGPVKDAVDETVNKVKGVASEQAEKTKQEILTSVENEVSNLTQQQLTSIKTQICTQWGVISPPPSPSPSPKL